jgi:hypothetical protein
MLAQADEVEDDAVDYKAWYAYQEWLASGERRVVVPFARPLVFQIPAVAVRLRRDFPMLLSLIKAHALLHRELRGRDKRGRIIAGITDYAAVRELISDLFSEGVEAAVAKTLRQTVEAVQRLAKDQPSVADLAEELKLDKSSASRRVKVAISKGYLVNRETGKGKCARIALGDPMPDDAEILPHPARLADCCTVAALQEEIDTPSPRPTAAPNSQRSKYDNPRGQSTRRDPVLRWRCKADRLRQTEASRAPCTLARVGRESARR